MQLEAELQTAETALRSLYDNVPLRMFIAIKILRAWNSGIAGYCGDAVATVNQWIDGGMQGPIPFPQSPFFAEWATKNGLSNIDGFVGFILKGDLVDSATATKSDS
jgi:hypothetical protein